MPTQPSLKFFLDPAVKAAGVTFETPRRGDAGFDVRSAEDLLLEAGQQVLVPTGLKLAVPEGWVAIVKDRSSMATKRIYSHAGVIDAGYRGEVKIVLSNHGSQSFHIERGQKIAQILVVPHLADSEEVRSELALGETARGAGGFGSTGSK